MLTIFGGFPTFSIVFLYYQAKQQTRKLHLFYLNVVCCFANRHTKHTEIIT